MINIDELRHWDYSAYPASEVTREMLGVAGYNPFVNYDSASRQQMGVVQRAQTPPASGSEVPRLITGLEREFGKYTHSIRMPADGVVVAVIQRYPVRVGENSFNDESIVIYEAPGGVLDSFMIQPYWQRHQLGYRFKPKPEALRKLQVGNQIPEGTIFYDTPNIADDGTLMIGNNACVARMTMPGVAEDGVVVSEEYLQRLGLTTLETRVINVSGTEIAKNMYGDDKNYKVFPDIGDHIRDDSILMCVTELGDPLLAPALSSPRMLRDVDYLNDKPTTVGDSSGVVVSIRVDYDGYSDVGAEYDAQLMKYSRALKQYMQKIIDVYLEFKRRRAQEGRELELGNHFHQMVVEAMGITNYTGSGRPERLSLQHKKNPIKGFRVEIVVMYENITPNIGFKLTEPGGGKGVICQRVPASHMPRDQWGRVADICMDPNSTFARMIPSQWLSAYYQDSLFHCFRNLKSRLGINRDLTKKEALDYLNQKPREEVYSAAWYLLKFYAIVASEMLEWFKDADDTKIYHHLAQVLQYGIYLYVPPEHRIPGFDVIRAIKNSEYRPPKGVVTYIGNSGKLRTTKVPIRLSTMEVQLLEKIANDWSAIHTPRLHYTGVPAPMNPDDKSRRAFRIQAVKGYDEAATALLRAALGAHYVARLMNFNNNPDTLISAADQILGSPTPGHFHDLTPGDPHLGGARPIRLVNHMFACMGFEVDWAAAPAR